MYCQGSNAMYMHILSSITPGIVALDVLARIPAAVPRAVEHRNCD